MGNIPLFLHDDVDTYFYNRKEDIRKIKYLLESLSMSIPQQLLLTGYRGVGKTYLIKKVVNELPSNILTVYLDISMIYGDNNTNLTNKVVLIEMLNKMNEAIAEFKNLSKINIQINALLEKIKTNDFDFTKPAKLLNISIPSMEDNYSKLSKFVMEFPQKVVDSTDDLDGFVIIMDEFQLLRKLEHPDAFFWSIRSHNQTQHNVSYVFTGSLSRTSEMIEELNGQSGAFGGRITQMNIEPFSFEETRNYFNDRMPEIKFTSDGFNRFYKCTRGIPLYINSFYNVLSDDEVYTASKIKEVFYLNMDQILVMWIRIWGTLNRYEKQIVEVLVEEKSLSWTDLYNHTSLTRGTFNKYLENLRNKGIVSYYNKEYQLEDRMLATWLLHEREVNGIYPL